MTLAATGTTETLPAASRSAHQVRLGIACGLFGASGWITWLTWRIATVAVHPLPVLTLAVELIGASAGLVIAAAMFRPPAERRGATDVADRGTAFAAALRAHVGRPVTDLSHPQV